MIIDEKSSSTPVKMPHVMVQPQSKIKILKTIEENFKGLMLMKLSEDYLKCFPDTELQKNHLLINFSRVKHIDFFRIMPQFTMSIIAVLKALPNVFCEEIKDSVTQMALRLR
ncbi:hypothetical protein CEXT_93611 [Caerostris extrusa]|uniref:Uncharacterized protein n=1 Tax=Caerostris extrusa TaxID=172846 RepID=A0AAV4NIH3_CAEEX|nr:hypothetical protein CEXT_93611 [Caerostris extrusa]